MNALIKRWLSRWHTWLGWGSCSRCHLSWNMVESHITPFGSEGSGYCPLCEGCWQQCSIEERLPYYRQLWLAWGEDNNWEQIRAAISAGR